MKTITMYQSENGRLFDSKEECQRYEMNSVADILDEQVAISEIIEKIDFYDYDGMLITTPTPTQTALHQTYYKSQLARVKQTLSDDTIHWLNTETNTKMPHKQGLYAWNTDSEEGYWQNYNEVREEYNSTWSHLTGIVLP